MRAPRERGRVGTSVRRTHLDQRRRASVVSRARRRRRSRQRVAPRRRDPVRPQVHAPQRRAAARRPNPPLVFSSFTSRQRVRERARGDVRDAAPAEVEPRERRAGRRRDRANRRRRAGVADARVVREAELSESARGVGEERGDVRGAGGADVRGRLCARRRGRVR